MRLCRAFLVAAVVAAALGPQTAAGAPDPGRAAPRTLAAAAAVDPPWSGAGAFVLSEGNIDPRTLALQLKANNFRWAAVIIHDGVTVDPIDASWIQRFRAAAGSSVLLGGWGVMRDQPEAEAALAAQLLDRYDFPFYVANAELEYKYSGDDGYSGERYGRSGRFVRAFRDRLPTMVAALSSYCHASRQDIDWAVWRDAGFDFLPQAYVNDFGADFGPDKCAEAAAGAFPMDRVHPTLGTYPSSYRVTADQYVTMLSQSPTTGFSLYLAEVDMTPTKWKTYGKAARAEVGAGAWPVPDTRPVVQTTGLVPPPILTLYTGGSVPVSRAGVVTLHFFSSRSGKLRLETDAPAATTIPIRSGQNLLRVALKGAGSTSARRGRPTYLQLTAVSPTGITGKTWVLKLRYDGR
ncbi:MAG: hypothetical protein ACM33B_11955 [Pseudomonadota bacterium]